MSTHITLPPDQSTPRAPRIPHPVALVEHRRGWLLEVYRGGAAGYVGQAAAGFGVVLRSAAAGAHAVLANLRALADHYDDAIGGGR